MSTYDVKKHQELCHRLFRMVMRAYYPFEYGVVTDTLLRMLAEARTAKSNDATLAITQSGVGDVELCQRLRLSPKLVREILLRLRADQLLCNAHSTVTSALSSQVAMRPRRLMKRLPRVKAASSWFVDWSRVVQTIRYRHSEMMAKMSAIEPEAGAVFFSCPSCKVKKNVMELMMDQPTHGGTFHCDDCFTRHPSTGVAQAVVLVIQDNTAEKIHASAKLRFNRQMEPIQNELAPIEQMLRQSLSLSSDDAKKSEPNFAPEPEPEPEPTKPMVENLIQPDFFPSMEAQVAEAFAVNNNFHHQQASSFVEQEEEAVVEASMLFHGNLVLVSQLTQDDIDAMTPEEWNDYTQFFDGEEDL